MVGRTGICVIRVTGKPPGFQSTLNCHAEHMALVVHFRVVHHDVLFNHHLGGPGALRQVDDGLRDQICHSGNQN